MEKKKPTEVDILMTLEAQAYGGLFPETPVSAKDILDFVNELRVDNRQLKCVDENAVVLTGEEADMIAGELGVISPSTGKPLGQAIVDKLVKDTAKKFSDLVEFHSIARMINGVEHFTISSLGLKEILTEEFGFKYSELNDGKEA